MQQVNKNRNSKMKFGVQAVTVQQFSSLKKPFILKGSHIYLEKHGEGTKLSSMDRVKIVFADKLLFGNKTKVSS